MAVRIPVQSPLDPEQFRPMASPVNRLVEPPQTNQAQQLAQALGAFSPLLDQIAKTAINRHVEGETLAGEQQAREWVQEGVTLRKAIEDGLITPDQSPWFRTGAEEFFARNAGMRYRDFLTTRMAESGISESTRLEDFDAFERDARREFAETVLGEMPSQTVALTFGRAADAVSSSMRERFAQQAAERFVQQTADEIQGSIMGVALDAHVGDVNPKAAAAAIKLDIERAIAMGMVDKGRVNRMAAMAIIDAARRTNDESLLEILEHVQTSPGNTLATVPGVTDAVEQATREIRQELRTQEAAEWEAAEREKKQRADELANSIVTDLIQASNPLLVPNFSDRVAELAQYDQALARSVFGAREAIANQKVMNDPRLVNELVYGVYTGDTTLMDAVSYLGAGMIDQAGLSQVLNHIQQLRSTSGSGNPDTDPAFDTDAYRMAESRLRQELGEGGGIFDQLDEQDKARIERAVQFLRREWYDQYHQRGAAGSGWMEQIQYLDPLVDNLVDQFRGFSPMTGEDLPVGPGNPGDPRWKWQPMGTPDVFNRLEAFTSVQNLSPTDFAILQALEVEIVPGDDETTAANIAEAVRQQRFLYNLKTRKTR